VSTLRRPRRRALSQGHLPASSRPAVSIRVHQCGGSPIHHAPAQRANHGARPPPSRNGFLRPPMNMPLGSPATSAALTCAKSCRLPGKRRHRQAAPHQYSSRTCCSRPRCWRRARLGDGDAIVARSAQHQAFASACRWALPPAGGLRVVWTCRTPQPVPARQRGSGDVGAAGDKQRPVSWASSWPTLLIS
jgi:hypothetical protein